MSAPQLTIGIDPGTRTGVAAYSPQAGQLITVETLGLWEAAERVLGLHRAWSAVLVIEDTRGKGVWGKIGSEATRAEASGIGRRVGSVQRDMALWVEFARHHRIPYLTKAPGRVPDHLCGRRKDGTSNGKISAEGFRRVTGYAHKCSQHGRDSGMLCYGIRPAAILATL